MDKRTVYQIRLCGLIDRDWSAWFDDWQVEHTIEGETILTGTMKDQGALFGALLKVRDLNLTLLAVNRLQADRDVEEGVNSILNTGSAQIQAAAALHQQRVRKQLAG